MKPQKSFFTKKYWIQSSGKNLDAYVLLLYVFINLEETLNPKTLRAGLV